MLRSKSLKIVSCGFVCAFAACIAMGQGTAPKTVRVKITTKENAPDVLKRLNQAGGGAKPGIYERRIRIRLLD
jgi:hypothetical protein